MSVSACMCVFLCMWICDCVLGREESGFLPSETRVQCPGVQMALGAAWSLPGPAVSNPQIPYTPQWLQCQITASTLQLPRFKSKDKRNLLTLKSVEPILKPVNEARETENANGQVWILHWTPTLSHGRRVYFPQTTWAESWDKMGPKIEIQVLLLNTVRNTP